jgi:hypothetical protein
MIDIDNHLGGGVDPFMEIGNEWLIRYGLRHWVIEITMYRTGFLTEPRVLKWAAERSIILEAHDTQGRTSATTVGKHDPFFGVGAMRKKYEPVPPSGLPIIDLPTGDAEARAKTELYMTQMLSFTDNVEKARRRTSDLLMASWFPQKVLRRWRSELEADREPQDSYEHSFSGYDMSEYGDLGGL